jgi:hypothetical protein
VRNDGIATVMLGLSRFWVLAVSEHDGEVEQAVGGRDRVPGCHRTGRGVFGALTQDSGRFDISRQPTRCRSPTHGPLVEGSTLITTLPILRPVSTYL